MSLRINKVSSGSVACDAPEFETFGADINDCVFLIIKYNFYTMPHTIIRAYGRGIHLPHTCNKRTVRKETIILAVINDLK